jgi:transcriptional regulator GlxA family with amidase domain
MKASSKVRTLLLTLALAAAASPLPAKEPAVYTRNVAIVLYEGVELLDFAGPGEVFGAAARFGSHKGAPAFNVYTVAVTKDPLKSYFVNIQPEYSIDDAPKPDVIVIPGGNTGNLVDNAKFMAWLKAAQPKTEVTLTVCTGAFTVAKLGLLDGKQVTTFYGAIDGLREQAPKATVIDGRRFVDNGSIITTAGVSAGIDGSLHAIARLLGRSVADRTARYMEYHWSPEPYLSQNYAYLNPSLDENGRRVQQAQLFEEEKNYAEAVKAYRTMTAENPKDGFAWYRLGTSLQSSGQLDAAIDAAKHATEFPDVRADAHFNIACAYARQGKSDAAIEQVQRAVAAGFKAKWALNGDPDLASIRSDARFQKIVASM